nr:MAG TPA: hypothetical protein [Bacteriophage sp.]
MYLSRLGIPDKDIDTLSHLTIYKTLLTTHC